MGVAEEWEEMEDQAREMEQLQRQVSNLTSTLAKLKTKDGAGSGSATAAAQSQSSDICHTESCGRPIDWYCRHCKTFMCTRCSKKPCGDLDRHEVEDFEDMYKKLKAKYADWQSNSETSLKTLTDQKKKLQAELAVGIQKMAAATPEDLMGEEMGKLVAELPAKRKRLEDIGNQLKTSSNSLSSVDVDSLTQTEFIKVFAELDLSRHIFEVIDLAKIKLGEEALQIQKKVSNDIDRLPTGELLLAGKETINVSDEDGNVLRTLSVPKGDFHAVQYYKGKIYAMLSVAMPETADKKKMKKRSIVVYDAVSYAEVKRWELPNYGYISQLALSNDKLYTVMPDDKKVEIYSLDGVLKTEFKHDAFKDPTYLKPCAPDGVLVSDWDAGIIYLIDSHKDRISLQYDVKSARGIFCDKYRNIWTWASKEKSFYVRSSDGKQLRKIEHKKLAAAGVEYISGMYVGDGKMWAACSLKGAYRLDVTIAN